MSDQQELLEHVPVVEDKSEITEPASTDDYVIRTSPEIDALERAAADGGEGRYYQNVEQAYARVHSVPGHSHRVELALTADEVAAGKTLSTLEELTRRQDADALFVLLYISQLLAPPGPIVGAPEKDCIVDLDDVIRKIGWNPRSTVERQEMRRQIWRYIQFGERAVVMGGRRGKYYDRMTKQTIETQIHAAIWRVVQYEMAADKKLQAEYDVPLRVELAMPSEWKRLLTSPSLAQYLPLGELLGSIPGKQPSGAWARVIGLALANFWRRNRKDATVGSLHPTRRQLLETYPPTTGSVHEVLQGRNPRRAVEYWHAALGILVAEEFLANEGEATLTAVEMRKKLGSRNWENRWLEGTAVLLPGAKMSPFLASIGQRQLPAPSVKES